jgi:hypothetical protein
LDCKVVNYIPNRAAASFGRPTLASNDNRSGGDTTARDEIPKPNPVILLYKSDGFDYGCLFDTRQYREPSTEWANKPGQFLTFRPISLRDHVSPTRR